MHTSSGFLKRMMPCCKSKHHLNLASALIISLLVFCSPKSHAAEELDFPTQPSEMETLPCCEKIPARFFIVGEYLYWKADLSGLELNFGSSSLVEGKTNGISFIDSKEFDIDPTFDWKSGYRVGCGVQLPNSNLSLSALWTKFKDKGHRLVEASHGIVNKGSCRVSLEQVDGVIAYACDWPSVVLEPFIGVRAAQINHSVNSQVITSITILPNTTATGVTNFDDHQHFKGIGPILGLHGDWMVACGFGLYGEGAIGVLYGNYKVKFNDSDIYSTPLSSQSTNRRNQHLHRFNANIDLVLGIFWRGCIFDNIAINLNLGYEFHEYYNLSYLGANRGDLSFNGVVASLGIAF